MPKCKHISLQSIQVQTPSSNSSKNYIAHTHTHTSPLLSDDATRSTTSSSGHDGSGDCVSPTRSRRLMSLTDQHTSDVEHGSTGDVRDGSTVCVEVCPCCGWSTRHFWSVGSCDGSTGAAEAKTTPTRQRN